MGRQLTVTVNGVPFDVEVFARTRDSVRFAVAGRAYEVELAKEAAGTRTALSARPSSGAVVSPALSAPSPTTPIAPGSSREVRTPMPGVVVAVHAVSGTRVQAGEVLITIEAMKMQNSIVAPVAGVVSEIKVQPGDEVMDGAVLLVIS